MFPLVLISLDGWGIGPSTEGNAIAACRPRRMEGLAQDYPSTQLEASGLAVGLPAGQMGNSEVGHMCMGAGRIVLQDLMRITRAIETGALETNPVLAPMMHSVAASGRALHIMGLTSDGGVHSHLDHAKALVRMARARAVRRIHFHAFLDGRDTAPRCAERFLAEMDSVCRENGGSIATVTGRYFAMDRDNRWERTERAYRAMTEGVGLRSPDALAALRAAYGRNEGDEFVQPTVIASGSGEPAGLVRDGDGVVFFNFRADRARQITRCFSQESFSGFTRRVRPKLAAYVCMTRYDETFGLPIAFPPAPPRRVLGEVLAASGLRQLRIAETEKYAHVTFFFNGGEEKPFSGEDRILIPSPKVATYDLQPEMSAAGITSALLDRLKTDSRELVVILNFANADMVGHTGVFDATVRACAVVDQCVGRIADDVLGRGGSVVVTADHGNAEQMIDPKTGGPHTAHTLNPVPVIVADRRLAGSVLRLPEGGTLADIGPTMLQMLKLDQPAEMTGRSLLPGAV